MTKFLTQAISTGIQQFKKTFSLLIPLFRKLPKGDCKGAQNSEVSLN